MTANQTIQTKYGRKVVRAMRFGVFSIHPAYSHVPEDRHGTTEWWTVTHAPTGMAIRRNCCCLAAAVRLVRRLKAFDWDFKSRRVPARLRKAGRIVKGEPLFCDACLR